MQLNNNIHVQILKDSLIDGQRITTFYLVYPRVIHSHLLTHRVFSRNSVSTRALSNKRIQNLFGYKPTCWRKEIKGMSSKEYLSSFKSKLANGIFSFSKYMSMISAYLLSKLGVHKEQTNDLISPYLYIRTLVTSTSFDNWFNLRADSTSATRYETYLLASEMQRQFLESNPTHRQVHIPFSDIDTDILGMFNPDQVLPDSYRKYAFLILDQIKKSVVKQARLSFGNEFNDFSDEQNKSLYDRLLSSKHLSPFEHIGMSHNAYRVLYNDGKFIEDLCGNFDGVVQLRKVLE